MIQTLKDWMIFSALSQKQKNAWIFFISIAFVALNSVAIAKEFFYFSLVPLGLLIVFLALFALDRLLMIVIFFVPLSVPLTYFMPGLSFNMALPTEPLLFGVLLLFILKLLFEKKFDRKVLLHPISIAIYFNLFWILLTSISSTMPAVSFKFLISRLWFVVAFYFLMTQIFVQYKNIKPFLWLYILPFLVVIAYTIARHISFGLHNNQAAHFVMQPFYNDHTSYGAMLAMYFPALVGLAFRSDYSRNQKLLAGIVLLIFIPAIVLSYTRAAWVSLAGALGVWVVLMLRIKLRTLIVLGVVLGGLLATQWTQIQHRLEKNRQDSSANLAEHVQSIANIASDASNLERLNRWKCALRMFEEKPVLGWGPGTYMFQYAPFQKYRDRTIISTNAADGGNAHSEYIGPLAEMGVLGAVSVLLIVIATLYTGIRVFRRAKEKEHKMLALTMLLGLVTYYLHGFLNNFLDTDKASVPFWGFMAVIVALDLYHVKNTAKTE